jgi:hypothetical protein
MPHERMRAIRWRGELLGVLEANIEVLEAHREAARRLVVSYPSPNDFSELLQQDYPVMPPVWAAVLEASLELFVQVQLLGKGSPQTRNDLRFTLRHFPKHFTIELFAQGRALLASGYVSSLLGPIGQPLPSRSMTPFLLR